MSVKRKFIKLMVACGLLVAVCAVATVLFVDATQPGPGPKIPTPPPVPQESAAKRFQFPAGGRQLFPQYQLVALYGSTDSPELGALGEQPLAESLARVKDMAANYQPLTSKHILPTFEIISTIASGTPTENNDYSREVDATKLLPWIAAAQKAGVYVVLDLQPGRSDFLTQAKQFEPLLRQPDVGLALDPEWRLAPNQLPLQQIGSVGIDEINQTTRWVAALTAKNDLPQKLLLVHQFRLDSLPGREQWDTHDTHLAYAIQMDGSGSQTQKLETWGAITASPPPNVQFGWKNFYHQDNPLLDPAGTMALTPAPSYVSYQ